MASIPASNIVNVVPGVISAGGTGLDMVGLLLTNNGRLPYGQVLRFASADAVAAYFGASSDEAAKAAVYFNGYVNSFINPAFLLFAAYATAARAAFLRGGTLGLTLSQLQALSGVLTLTVNGTAITSGTINLSAATSFSNAATIIQAAFTTPNFAVSYDAIADAFVFTSTTTGAASTITAATGTLSAPLNLSAATGAIVSPGAAVDTPSAALTALVAQTQDFVSFTTLFAPSDADILAFARWNSGRGNRFLYVPWLTPAAATGNSDTTSPARVAATEGLSGTAFIYSPSADKAVFAMGYVASIDFNRTNGRTTAAFRRGAGLLADVTNETIAQNLLSNGYNFYGTYATANDAFTWLYNGQVAGEFGWIDSYINQIWLNNAFQLSLMALLRDIGQIPYNDDGYEQIGAGIQTDIDNAVDFGAIRAGVTLTEAQRVQVNSLAAQDISDILFTRGWYLSVQDPGGQARANRQSPVCTFFYTDGQSVQRINLSSLMVQ